MSFESPGDCDGKKISVLADELYGLQINNNKMSMSLTGPQRANVLCGDDNDDDDADDNGIEMGIAMRSSVCAAATAADVGAYSENESENSSVGLGLIKRQTALLLNAAQNKPIPKNTRAIRTNAATVKRAMSLPRTTQQPTKHLTPSKQFNNNLNNPTTNNVREFVSSGTPLAVRLQARSAQKPQKPNTLPQVQSRAWKPGGVALNNTKNVTAATKQKVINVNNGTTPMDRTAYRVRPSLVSGELKSTPTTGNHAANPYGTMPRRRKQKSIDDLQDNRTLELRSQSVSRDTRMTASIGAGTRRQLQLNCSGISSNSSSTWTTPTQPYPLHWSNFNSNANKQNDSMRRQQQRTKIFYEQSVQTSITCSDLDKLMANGTDCDIESRLPAASLLLSSSSSSAAPCQNNDRETQCSDIRDHELERLRDEVRALSATLQREREEKLIMQRELQMNSERVMGMLELARVSSINGSAGGWTPTSEDDASSCSVSGHDSLLMLESQIQMSGHELIERQQEIRQLRQLCRSLQTEMERSVAAQQCLLQEKAAIEEESNEMQDFLQHEKAAMYDALRELEADFEHCKCVLNEREEEVKTLREKCRYLVRSNEQRRQENLLLQTKNSHFKSKSKDQVAIEHATVMAAFNALSKLHLRLKSLVDELKLTYNISEQELELQIAQLENQGESGGEKTAGDHSISAALLLEGTVGGDADDGALSPERHKSFIAAIIGAIRGASTPHKRPIQRASTDGSTYASDQQTNFNGNGNGTSNDGEMLDLETEPCLMMDTVLQDVEINDTYSHNLISMAASAVATNNTVAPTNTNTTTTDMELINVLNNELILNDTLSFHNLSQAIVNRKNMEEFTNEANQFNNDLEMMNDNCFAKVKDIIAKVSDVDVLVTRLLRLIQMDNDNCIQQLIIDKNKLQQHKEEMLDKIRELQEVNVKLQDDLMDATQELMLKNSSERNNAKKELSAHHSEIDEKKIYETETTTKTKSIIVNEKLVEKSAMKGVDENAILDCGVIEVMDLLHKLQGKTETELALKPLCVPDVEGNVQGNFTAELPSPNQLEDILNTFDTVDNLDDIDAEVQQTIMKLKENWSTLCLSSEDFVDTNANNAN